MANTISSKSTKTEIMTFLRDTFKDVSKLDVALAKTIKYASDKIKKDAKSVTKADLLDLAQKVMQLTGIVTKPVEASSKLGAKSTPLASIFPTEFTIEGSDFVAVPFKYQTMDEIRKAVNEDGKVLIFATYWTSRLIRQFDYADMFQLKKMTNQDVISVIENDLDIMSPRIVLNEEDIVVAVSAYTEAICQFKGEDLKAVEDTDKDGNKYVLRFSNGMEFQIYELADKTTDKDKETAEETPEKDDEKEPSEQPNEEKVTSYKKKFSSKAKKTADNKASDDNKTEDK